MQPSIKAVSALFNKKVYSRILVMRLSSIGDIILTTPILRALRQGFPEAQLHFLVKPQFISAIEHNPHLDVIHELRHKLADNVAMLEREEFDYVIDLQKSLRTIYFTASLGLTAKEDTHSFSKHNFTKWRMTALKQRLAVPHIVTRYAESLQPLGLSLDDQGLEFPITPAAFAEADSLLATADFTQQPYAIAIGATHFTKRWPADYFAELLNRLGRPAILLGGPSDRLEADVIRRLARVPLLDAVGRTSLLTSAALMARSSWLLTHDTGLMHIGAALGLRTASLWGNTVPEFGMTPYRTPFIALEVPGLPCRPCTKIGHKACPRGHFNCMRQLTPALVEGRIRETGWL